MKKDIIKNPLRLTIKLFITTWIILILQIALKITFNYWQPYVIPTEQLETLSNFIDKTFIKDILDFLLYIINGTFMMLASIVRWWFKDKKQSYIFFGTCMILGALNLHPVLCNFTPIISCFVLPLLFDRKKWVWIIATFILNFVFLKLSLILSEVTNTADFNYIEKVFFQFDYYIMLVLNYITFNLLKIYIQKRGNKKWAKIYGFLGLEIEA